MFFRKYHSTGNDFILIDDRLKVFPQKGVQSFCQRKFGIGADGLILFQSDLKREFVMRFFNSDGFEAACCGNGLCCFVQFLFDLKIQRPFYQIFLNSKEYVGLFLEKKIEIQMGKIGSIQKLMIEGTRVYFVNGEVPHLVLFSLDFDRAKWFRSHPQFSPEGVNVNFAQIQKDGSIQVRTYERGVEGETLSCGTGAMAVAVVAKKAFQIKSPISLNFPGGQIKVFIKNEMLSLLNQPEFVFEGRVPMKTRA